MRMVFDGAGNLTSAVPFATGLSGPVHMELGPDGSSVLCFDPHRRGQKDSL